MCMTILVSGSRDWTDKEKIKAEIAKYPEAFVIMGDCRGADQLAFDAVNELGVGYQSMVFYADWDKEGRAAGPNRNIRMLDHFDHDRAFPKKVIVFHSNLESSKGTKHMVDSATQRGFLVKVVQ